MDSRSRRPPPAVEADVKSEHDYAPQSGPLLTPPAPWPWFSDDEIAAVERVLRSGNVNYWTGRENCAFEREFAQQMGVRHALALSSGSVALDVAIAALGIGPGDEVILSPRSYIASTSSVLAAGAKPVFADVDPDSQNITAESIARAVSPATRAVIPVHLAGWPCDMPAIMELAQANGLLVIEDCAQAHGASVGGIAVGAFGHAAAFSFCQDKIMTTGGEGGMVLTSDDEIWQRAWSRKDNGKSPSAMRRARSSSGFRWVHESLGSNFRMTEMQAAIGRVQLRKLRHWVQTRRAHADCYRDTFAPLVALRTPEPGPEVHHSYYKFYTFVRPDALRYGWSRDRIIGALCDLGVPCQSGSCPEIYREKVVTDLGFAPAQRLPVARDLGETSLVFLLHPTLTTEQVSRMAETAVELIASASL